MGVAATRSGGGGAFEEVYHEFRDFCQGGPAACHGTVFSQRSLHKFVGKDFDKSMIQADAERTQQQPLLLPLVARGGVRDLTVDEPDLGDLEEPRVKQEPVEPVATPTRTAAEELDALRLPLLPPLPLIGS